MGGSKPIYSMCIVQCCAVAHAIKRKFIAQTAIGNKACRSQGEREEKRCRKSVEKGARKKKADRERRRGSRKEEGVGERWS